MNEQLRRAVASLYWPGFLLLGRSEFAAAVAERIEESWSVSSPDPPQVYVEGAVAWDWVSAAASTSGSPRPGGYWR